MHETETRHAAAIAVANGATYRETAQVLGISERSLQRWAETDTDFAAVVEQERAARRARLEGLCDTALDGLRAMAENEDTPAYVRRQAWADVLLFYQKERDREMNDEEEALDRALREKGLIP